MTTALSPAPTRKSRYRPLSPLYDDLRSFDQPSVAVEIGADDHYIPHDLATGGNILYQHYHKLSPAPLFGRALDGLMESSPSEVRLVVIDPAFRINGERRIPHLQMPIVRDNRYDALAWVATEFNERWEMDRCDFEKLPHLVVMLTDGKALRNGAYAHLVHLLSHPEVKRQGIHMVVTLGCRSQSRATHSGGRAQPSSSAITLGSTMSRNCSVTSRLRR